MTMDEIDCRTWAGVQVDDDPTGLDQMAEDALEWARRQTWPRRVVELLERLKVGAL